MVQSANRRADRAAAEIEADLRAVGTPARAEAEQRYLKSDLTFLGATVWQTRGVVKDSVRETDLDHAGLIALVDALWDAPVFERRMAAVILLELHPKLLAARDLPRIERLIRESRTWALVDGLAADVAGGIRAADPSVRAALDRWSVDADFWVRRASLLAELRPLRKGADLEPFLERADRMLDEREFFIRKAIGWALRQYARVDPESVARFVTDHRTELSGLSYREATKHIGHLVA